MSDVRARGSYGQELVEYAITLPFFLLLVLGIFDLGRGVYYYSVLQNAAREGARYAIVHPEDDAGVEARVKDRAIGLDPDDIVVTIDPPDWSNDDTITVTAVYTYELVIPFLDAVFPGGMVGMESRSTMLREKW